MAIRFKKWGPLGVIEEGLVWLGNKNLMKQKPRKI